MSKRPWLHAVEADFARETRAEEAETEQIEREDAAQREPFTPWEEFGGTAA